MVLNSKSNSTFGGVQVESKSLSFFQALQAESFIGSVSLS
jgi:hypothetical protein